MSYIDTMCSISRAMTSTNQIISIGGASLELTWLAEFYNKFTTFRGLAHSPIIHLVIRKDEEKYELKL